MNKEIIVTLPKTQKEVVAQVIENIKEQRKSRISLAMTVLHGKFQSGKTEATKAICEEYYDTFSNIPLITLTYPSKHLWSQLDFDYKDVAVPIKLYDLDLLLHKNKNEFETLMKRHQLLIIEEGDYANGEEGKLQRVLAELDSATNTNGTAYNLHILFIGATNFHQIMSELTGNISIKTSHVRLPAGEGYFGINEMLENGNIIDIGDLETGPYAINDGKFTKEFWNLFDESFKGFDKGFAAIRIKPKDEHTNKSISLCDKIAKSFKKNRPDFRIFKAYDANQNGADWIKDEITSAQVYALNEKVVVIMIDGLSAGVRLNQKLKEKDLLRFAYETSTVASSAGQGLPARFNGYYLNSKTGKYFNPTCKILVSISAIDVCQKFDKMIDAGKITLEGTSDYCKPSTHLIHKVTERINIPAKFVEMGKISDLGISKKLVQTSKNSNAKIRKKLKDDANTVMECSHKSDPTTFTNKWNAALDGMAKTQINLLDIAYAYYATDNMKQFVYLFNMNGDYIKYECLDRSKSNKTEVKRSIKNKSLYTNTFV